MKKFKVGDKVRCNHYDIVGFIVSIISDGEVIIERNDSEGRHRSVDEYVPKDYVSIAGDSYWYCPTFTLKKVK